MTPTPSTSHTIQTDTSRSVGRHAPVPGALLARLKGQLAINTFLQRFPEASGCDAGAGALAPGAIAVRTGKAEARPEGRECLTLKLPLVAMQIPLAV